MGAMKTIFTDIQLALEDGDFVSVLDYLKQYSSEPSEQNETLRAVVNALADWQRGDIGDQD